MPEIVASLNEIPDGGSIRRPFAGREVALFRKGDVVHAIDAQCPHRGGPLDGGDLEDDCVVVCPWHGWRFDIRTGKSPTHPGQVRCYKVTVADGKVAIAE